MKSLKTLIKRVLHFYFRLKENGENIDIFLEIPAQIGNAMEQQLLDELQGRNNIRSSIQHNQITLMKLMR